MILAAGLLATVELGCCSPLIVSRRFAEGAAPCATAVSDETAASCECGSAWEHILLCARRPHRLLPGADGDGHGWFAEPIQPPLSKFHPVPTRPVFAPRPEYEPPQPLAPLLAPVPTPAGVAPAAPVARQ
ncbi:MAG: hypothetical protein AB7F89_17870 [Pirellulaceae bacterium]